MIASRKRVNHNAITMTFNEAEKSDGSEELAGPELAPDTEKSFVAQPGDIIVFREVNPDPKPGDSIDPRYYEVRLRGDKERPPIHAAAPKTPLGRMFSVKVPTSTNRDPQPRHYQIIRITKPNGKSQELGTELQGKEPFN
jgi:hypothetical protein